MITPEMLKEFYQKATEIALSQKSERDLFQEPMRGPTARVSFLQTDHARSEGGHGSPSYAPRGCPQCGFAPLPGSQIKNFSRCPNCGYSFTRSRSVGLGAEGGI